MKVGIIGSGMVARQLGLGFLRLGHEVKLGTRNPDKLGDWLKQAGRNSSVGSFEDSAKFGEMIVLAAKWADGAAESAVKAAGKANFSGKVVIDVMNPLIFAGAGQPPTLEIGFPQSAGAIVQSWLPEARVVKAFNILTAYYMTEPKLKDGTPDMFIAGNDREAKNAVIQLAKSWGWQDIHDVGDIDQAYLLEALAMLWIRYGAIHNYWKHAFKLLKQ